MLGAICYKSVSSQAWTEMRISGKKGKDYEYEDREGSCVSEANLNNDSGDDSSFSGMRKK